MKKLWSKLLAARERLPRRWRIGCNLALVLASCLCLLFFVRWPALTQYGEFRRMEERLLLTPSELVKTVDHGDETAFLSEGESWITVGKVTRLDSGVVTRDVDSRILYVLPKDGLVVLAMPAPNEELAMVAAVWGAPEEAEAGRITVGIEREFFTAEARREKNGWFFFELKPHEEEQRCTMEQMWLDVMFWEGVEDKPYFLELWDNQGKELARQEGKFPLEQRYLALP